MVRGLQVTAGASHIRKIGDWPREPNDDASPIQIGPKLANYRTLFLSLVYLIYQQECPAEVYGGS